MKKLTIVILILALGFLLTGCKVTGGGWFIDQCGNKCTLGFNAQATEECPYEVKGQFQFNDHDGNKVHASVTGLLKCCVNEYYLFWGETKGGKTVGVFVKDEGEPGVGAGDYVKVHYDGMDWEGALGGGNIQGH